MLQYHLGWENVGGSPDAHVGKRLRPALCLLTCEAVGGDTAKALPLAAAVELVHNFSLVHDDIQDGDRKRHGRDTVWAVWGLPQAINAGDALLSIAHLSLTESLDVGLSAEAAVCAAVSDSRLLERLDRSSYATAAVAARSVAPHSSRALECVAKISTFSRARNSFGSLTKV